MPSHGCVKNLRGPMRTARTGGFMGTESRKVNQMPALAAIAACGTLTRDYRLGQAASARCRSAASPRPARRVAAGRSSAATGEDRHRLVFVGLVTRHRPADQLHHPPGDRRRRVDPGDRPGRQAPASARAEAGNGCRPAPPHRCARLPSSTKQGASSASIVRIGDRLARKLGLGEAGETGRADEVDPAAGGIGLDEVAGIVARHRPGRREHRDVAGRRGLRRRLDGRHRPDEGIAKRSRRCGSTRVEAVLQAITTRSGACSAISRSMTASTRADQRLLAQAAHRETPRRRPRRR